MASDPVREYTVIRKGTSSMILAPDSSVPLYTCDIPALSFTKHSLTLHQGDSTTGAVLGACLISPFSSTIKLALGDPKDSSGVIWENLRYRLGRSWTGEYDLSVELPSGTGKRHEFSWKTTHAVDGAAKKIDGRHLKLVEKSTGSVVARFIHTAGSWTKRGVVEFWQDVGEDRQEWERVVLLSALGVLELKNRTRAAGAAGAGG